MLKNLFNNPERITYERLSAACTRHGAEVHAKVRLADVLPIEGSGLSETLHDFALKSHYDFVVYGQDQAPLFAVEFDGLQHHDDPEQARRDAIKDGLSRQFGLPLHRLYPGDLSASESGPDHVTELIERWFNQRAGDASAQSKPLCPICLRDMIERPGKYGRFLSCVRWPDCKGARDLPMSPKRTAAQRWRKALILGSIGAALVLLFATLLLRYESGSPHQGGTHQPPGPETQAPVSRIGSSMTLEQRQAYASALKQSDYPRCPLCGKRMVVCHNNATGEPFFGCSTFPRCRGSRDIQYPE